jgi:L-lysine 6-transaminase
MVRFGRILQVIEDENLVQNAADVGRYLQDKIHLLSEQFEHVTNPRGKGLFCAVDFPNTHARDSVIKECFNNNLMILSCGERTMRFRPPLTVNKQHIEEGIEIIEKSIKSAMDKCPALKSK